MEIRPINFSDIPPALVLEGERHDLIFKDTSNAHYFGGFVDGQLVTFECLMIYKNWNASIKANFTVPEFRGRGYFTELNKHVLNYAREHGVRVINLNCLKDSVGIHQKQGARLWKATRNIYWMTYDRGF